MRADGRTIAEVAAMLKVGTPRPRTVRAVGPSSRCERRITLVIGAQYPDDS